MRGLDDDELYVMSRVVETEHLTEEERIQHGRSATSNILPAVLRCMGRRLIVIQTMRIAPIHYWIPTPLGKIALRAEQTIRRGIPL